MWVVAFASQRRALLDAKAMLLIDHDKGQIFEGHTFLDQSMRTHDRL